MAITVPRGFRLTGLYCGIKQDPNKHDLTLVVSDAPCVAAGVYTQNLVYAAPVELDRARTPSANVRAVVVNSGNANACTGERGLRDAHEMARLAAEACGASQEQALVMSTGIIGEHLPMDRIAKGIADAATRLGSDEASFDAAARGIITTDQGTKTSARQLDLVGHSISIAGMAKGAGMIGPNMATMLGLVLTDAVLSPQTAQSVLASVVDETFNCICVEGHTSTNDTVLLLASGAAGGEDPSGAELETFRNGLYEVCLELAKAIPADGEGASHLIEIEVRGCRTRADAHRIAKTVAESPLVRTGIAGADPNWGRIVSAAGYAGIAFDPARLDLHLNGTALYRQGAPVPFDAAAVSKSMRENRDVYVLLELAEGDASVRFWSSDLTVDYVRFNADYHT